MSKFRSLVEEIINPEQKYIYLTPEMRNGIDYIISKRMDDVDPSELQSARWDNNPYGVEPQLRGGSGAWDYDEDELFNAASEDLIDAIESDGIFEYFLEYNGCISEDTIEDIEAKIDEIEGYETALNNEAIEYIRNREI